MTKYNPAYGLPDQIRLACVATAVAQSPKVAAEQHRVGLSSVYRWMRYYGVFRDRRVKSRA